MTDFGQFLYREFLILEGTDDLSPVKESADPLGLDKQFGEARVLEVGGLWGEVVSYHGLVVWSRFGG